ncbi:non-specific lipid transfer protein GPI-anchored 21-like [Curcuma longa]|uniref:non-specific lipid transfer protein GPI-anchored 21-like n=1 Tax=Curcuma longa TaxID=136217 RepID=UPI003D9E7949
MEAATIQRSNCFVVFPLILLLLLSARCSVDGAGECGRVPVQQMAVQMALCATAAQDATAQVSSGCCSAVQRIGQNPGCLCAVMLSDIAKSVGVKPEIAITIPKRCKIANRPVGYKCGGYTLP